VADLAAYDAASPDRPRLIAAAAATFAVFENWLSYWSNAV
jgi:hypothetical protein